MSVTGVTTPSQLVRIYTNSDATTFTKTGGDLVWRDNNSGNLEFTTLTGAQNYGALALDSYHTSTFTDPITHVTSTSYEAIFPTEVWGAIATEADILNNYSSNTINYMVGKFAPSFENDTVAYQRFLTSVMGVSGTTVISTLSDSKLTALVNLIFRQEGSDPDGSLTGNPSGGILDQAHSWLLTTNATATTNKLTPLGYYVTIPADVGITTADTASSIAGQDLNAVSISGPALENLNAVFSDSGSATGGNTSFSTGGLVHVPVSKVPLSSTLASLPTLFGDLTYVVDPSSSAAYVVGSSLDNHDAGSLVIDNDVSSGDYTTFTQGTFAGASVSGGNASISLATPDGFVLGTYDTDPSFTFSDGTVITLPDAAGVTLTDSLGSSATPEEVLISYLSQLGDTVSSGALNTDNFDV